MIEKRGPGSIGIDDRPGAEAIDLECKLCGQKMKPVESNGITLFACRCSSDGPKDKS